MADSLYNYLPLYILFILIKNYGNFVVICRIGILVKSDSDIFVEMDTKYYNVKKYHNIKGVFIGVANE